MLSTAHKVAIARGISAVLLGAGLAPVRRARRAGIAFELDLREGIDLSLFLFGVFQGHVLELTRRWVPADGVIVDVGANIGAMTLPMAQHVARGRVLAVEPTDFAVAKLRANLALNPALAARVSVFQTFLADRPSTESALTAYSRWPVGTGAAETHPVHKGVAMPAPCGQTTLDELAARENLPALSLIKIDTDGHEFVVLSGATRCLERFRPVVVFEASEYLMQPPQARFEEFESLLRKSRYRICDPRGAAPLSAAQFRAQCPRGGSLDLVALPEERVPA
jgi:FkbM family methyltransferase